MNISHHPPEHLLTSHVTGALGEAERLVVAVHVAGCARCSRFVQAMEQIAGAAIEEAGPEPMAADAFDRVMAHIHERPAPAVPVLPLSGTADDLELPELLRRCRIGKRRRVAPGVSMRPIELSGGGAGRAFLLQSAPGARLVEHTHTGTELTCVLRGSFIHQGGRYGPGDFDYGDDDVDHRPIVGDEGPCLCLVAMTGELRMNGFLGRLISPFVRL